MWSTKANLNSETNSPSLSAGVGNHKGQIITPYQEIKQLHLI